MRTKGGFTLIELLVVLLVVSILLSLVIAGLSEVRRQARLSICLSNLRQTGAAVNAYAERYDGRFMYARPWEGRGLLIRPLGDDEQAWLWTTNFFNLENHWPAVMHQVAPWREWFGSWVCAGSRRSRAQPWGASGTSSYRYSSNFTARPELWNGTSPPEEALLQPTSMHEVQYPAAKVLMWDAEQAHNTRASASARTPMLFADGHVRAHREADASQPVPNPFRRNIARHLTDTRMGVRGWDYR